MPRPELISRLGQARQQLAGVQAAVGDDSMDAALAVKLVRGILSGAVKVELVPTLNPQEFSVQLRVAPEMQGAFIEQPAQQDGEARKC